MAKRMNRKTRELLGRDMVMAVDRGDITTVKKIIDRGFSVKGSSGSDDPLLYIAAWKGYSDIVELLANSGCRINAREKSKAGWTALHAACHMKYPDTVELLIKLGADVNIVDDNHITPLFLAVVTDFRPDYCNRILNLLIKAGADVNRSDKTGWAPMHMAACRNNAEAIRILAKAGADINKKTKHGATPIISAAKMRGAANAVVALIDLGADLSVKYQKKTVLDILKNNYKEDYARIMQYIYMKERLTVEDSIYRSGPIVDFDI